MYFLDETKIVWLRHCVVTLSQLDIVSSTSLAIVWQERFLHQLCDWLVRIISKISGGFRIVLSGFVLVDFIKTKASRGETPRKNENLCWKCFMLLHFHQL